MKEIKFRFWDKDLKKMCFRHPAKMDFLHPNIVPMQFTGIIDNNGREIYSGDIIQHRQPYRTEQTHTGDNIPNGSYTEPMEPAIKTIESEVIFKDGMFGVEMEYNATSDFIPLAWIIPQYDEDSIKSSIAIGKPGWDIWDEPEEGDLQYLLEQYNCFDLKELIEYVNVFDVVGNRFENPELL